MSEIRRTSDMSEVKLDEVLVELADLKAKYQKAVEALRFYSSGEFPWSNDSEYDNGNMADETLAELGEKE